MEYEDQEENQNALFVIVPILIGFSFLSIFYITMGLISYGIINDNILSPVQDVADSMEASGYIRAGLAMQIQTWASDFLVTSTYIDQLWLMAYIVFIFSTILYCYKSKPQNYFSLLTILFYGVMLILFLLSIVVQVVLWFNDNFTQRLFDNITPTLPMFGYWLAHIGIFYLIHILVCIIAMNINLNLTDFGKRKDAERIDREVL
jgi:hypothetical protein